jgi:hypothetical protein
MFRHAILILYALSPRAQWRLYSCLVIIDLVLTDFGYLVLLLIRSPRAVAAGTLFLRSENSSHVSGMPGHASSSRRRHLLSDGRLESLDELVPA